MSFAFGVCLKLKFPFFVLRSHCIRILCIISVSLNGTPNGNTTETFVGFIINVYNELEDEESGQFVKPPPEGTSVTECHYLGRSYFVRSTLSFRFFYAYVK